MALSIFLRNPTKIIGKGNLDYIVRALHNITIFAGFRNILRATTIPINNSAKFSQINPANTSNKISIPLSQQCTALQLIKPSSLTSLVSVQKFSTTSSLQAGAGNHAFMWSVERLMAVALLLIIPATFILDNAIMDNIFAVCIVAHSHWQVYFIFN